ncbi:hypothetical protein [Sodalinema gerasimenkoae]|uniref:hypothetical protein n=1 Tax=Sodalinema gerasimenkoae TaxID=2862348 RepID=UPI001FE8CDD1|nr:hypothetical protein [Sodalinema gerasimenkoae]
MTILLFCARIVRTTDANGAMLVLEFKIKGKPHQYAAIDEAIRTAQFVRNKALRYWFEDTESGEKPLSRQVNSRCWLVSI